MSQPTFRSVWAPLVLEATSEDDFINRALAKLGSGSIDAGRAALTLDPLFNLFLVEIHKAMDRFNTRHWEDPEAERLMDFDAKNNR